METLPHGSLTYKSRINNEIIILKIVKHAEQYDYSNTDVLGFDPITNRYYDYEVKFRSAYLLSIDGR
jgi:hypothetical protein